MLYSSDLERVVLLEPAVKCNRLRIVSGFTDCEMISSHAIKLADGFEEEINRKINKIELIVGMGLGEKKHKKILRTVDSLKKKNTPQIDVFYVTQGPLVHSKVYTWFDDDRPVKAFIGSANYSDQAFRRRREVMDDCDPFQADNYFEKILKNSISFREIGDDFKFLKSSKVTEDFEDIDSLDYSYYDKKTPVAVAEISLLTVHGEVGFGSGINWGIRPNGTRRERNQAYIPYNKPDKIAGFFPDRLSPDDKNCPLFRVVTREGLAFHMRMAQQGNKALHSAENNSILGSWIRQKIGAEPGQFVTKEMLENYGKTAVTFRKYEDGTYLLDF